MEVLIMVFFWFGGLFLSFLIIKWAIDSSETAGNIRIIRKILNSQYPSTNSKEDMGVKSAVNLDILGLESDECPACHTKIQETDLECTACGLKLKI